ncbi:tetratricopeptide repeat protein [Cellulomonas sp. B6]|uniref:tetratricopeptide repeat protein n=1 Tax=Cellulomonas sp. B6 TaxID=1295626 RepID=UPI00073B9C27|nr:tetratricopeptide repeat protein [Cellulomonas sp. B6]KSW29781.1 hypothetical protein ATM99_06520 [Cellulomonas sp. B6]
MAAAVPEPAPDQPERTREVGRAPDVDALLDRGVELFDTDRLQAAAICFRAAADRGSAVAWFDLGNTLRRLDLLDDAEAAYREAIAGGETDALLNLGLLLVDRERWDEAVAELRAAAAQGSTAAWHPLGYVLAEVGDLDGAHDALTVAVASGDADAAVTLAHLLRDAGDLSAALGRLREASSLGEPTAAGLAAAWEWEATGDASLEPRLRAEVERSSAACDALARLLAADGRRREAIDVLEDGAERGFTDLFLRLGNLLHDAGEPEAAARAFEQDIATGDSFGHQNLGVVLEELGDVGGALEQYRIGADLGDAMAAESLARLRADVDRGRA